jgi:hypothetical protein
MSGMTRSERAWAKWRGLVEAQEASGLSVLRFCEERGIPASSLFAWRRKLRGGAAPHDGTGSADGGILTKVWGRQPRLRRGAGVP